MEADILALDTRSGLPEALRVLLQAYPRAAWEEDPGFSDLIRFWLDRHIMFRSLASRIRDEARKRLDGTLDPRLHAKRLARYGGLFVNDLHAHHHIEDARFFPVLSQHDARIEHGFTMLDADHQTLDRHLHAVVTNANAVLEASDNDGAAAGGRFLDAFEAFVPFLTRHLEDEEELVVPVLLHYGEAGLG